MIDSRRSPPPTLPLPLAISTIHLAPAVEVAVFPQAAGTRRDSGEGCLQRSPSDRVWPLPWRLEGAWREGCASSVHHPMLRSLTALFGVRRIELLCNYFLDFGLNIYTIAIVHLAHGLLRLALQGHLHVAPSMTPPRRRAPNRGMGNTNNKEVYCDCSHHSAPDGAVCLAPLPLILPVFTQPKQTS